MKKLYIESLYSIAHDFIDLLRSKFNQGCWLPRFSALCARRRFRLEFFSCPEAFETFRLSGTAGPRAKNICGTLVLCNFFTFLRCRAPFGYHKRGAWGHGPLDPLKTPLSVTDGPATYFSRKT